MLFLCNFIHLKKRYEHIYGGIELFWDLNEIFCWDSSLVFLVLLAADVAKLLFLSGLCTQNFRFLLSSFAREDLEEFHSNQDCL